MDDDTSSGLLGVGAIVWVRRRNGSWWPGKILSPEQLPSAHLTSPRSGTPVKLLGREDASVDWYNLEKSKRVRPFRCGEFDDCIERAVASLGMPPKKREKYARREDAILHALELEKQMLGDVLPLDNGHVRRAETTDEELLLRSNSFHQGVPRMRNLQDFGLRIVPSKRRDSPSVKPKMRHDGRHRPHTLPDEDGDFVDSRLTSRSKRTRCVYSQHDNSACLDDGNPSARSWELTTSTNHRAHYLMAPDVPRVSDDTDAGTTESDFSASDSDSAETEHDDDDDETTSVSDHLGGHKGRGDFESMSSEDHDDSILSEDFSRQFDRNTGSANGSVSKWQLKGKRNIRNLPKRHVEDIERLHANGRRFTSRRRVPIWRSDDYRDYDFSYSIDSDDDDDDEDDEEEEDYGAGDDSQDTENDACGLDDDYAPTPGALSRDQNLHTGWDHVAWEGDYYNPIMSAQPHLGDKDRSTLVEVDLKVMARYQIDPEKRLPIISMTSKLNGNSIIGHAVQIEAIRDGSSDNLVSASYEANEAIDSYALPSGWRTARRTANVRLRRPTPSSIDGDEDGRDFPFLLQHETSPTRVSGGGSSGRKGLLVRKGAASRNHLPQVGKSLSGKTSKKVGSSSSQKIRTLSSIALEQKQVSRSLHDSLDYQADGIIKPSSSVPTTVACIPVKLVYSRLLEKINRQPSKAVLNLGRLNSETIKG
ncbi:hypothetical protein MLD38_019812 [Melastoma candidum]|uniref:Uncharacterized protein n=1 Tax=Melastoma candidum TaxID=119954 RepID=A0ACB9QES9_9MYRT|nr:hypothetical protein MLD38_019812 [Melastoma candidum]